jgi:hypothetical protein
MEQAFVSERNTEYRPRLRTTRRAREPPTTTLAYTRSEIAKKRATQPSQLQTAKGNVSKCSRTRSVHDDDEYKSHLAHVRSNGGGS